MVSRPVCDGLCRSDVEILRKWSHAQKVFVPLRHCDQLHWLGTRGHQRGFADWSKQCFHRHSSWCQDEKLVPLELMPVCSSVLVYIVAKMAGVCGSFRLFPHEYCLAAQEEQRTVRYLHFQKQHERIRFLVAPTL
jgi:hypothetical protein